MGIRSCRSQNRKRKKGHLCIQSYTGEGGNAELKRVGSSSKSEQGDTPGGGDGSKTARSKERRWGNPAVDAAMWGCNLTSQRSDALKSGKGGEKCSVDPPSQDVLGGKTDKKARPPKDLKKEKRQKDGDAL